MAFNAPSLQKFAHTVQPGGTVIYDSSVMTEPAEIDPSVTAVGIPCTQIARDLGSGKVKNVVALGAMQAATGLFPAESMLTAIRDALQANCAMQELNQEAFSWGVKAYEEITEGVN